jgi:hypothetical protein
MKGVAVLVGDHRLKHNHESQADRAWRAVIALVLPEGCGTTRKEAEEAARVTGVHGASVLMDLPYMNLQEFFLVPVAHALLYGVAKRLVQTLIRPLRGATGKPQAFTYKERRIIVARAGDIIISSDFGRPYRDMVNYA